MTTVGLNLDGGVHEIPVAAVAGRLWLCGKHVIGPDPDALLGQLGADTVVCLVERHELIDRYPNYVAWLEAAPPGRAVKFPVPDLSAPALTAMRPLLDDLATRLRAGESVVIHCGAGLGRAGTTAVALLILLGTSLDDALVHVRAHRPMAGPEVGSQLDLVMELAAHLASGREPLPQQVAGHVEPQGGGQPQ
jgi:protein-tyrosine phosphatase